MGVATRSKTAKSPTEKLGWKFPSTQDTDTADERSDQDLATRRSKHGWQSPHYAVEDGYSGEKMSVNGVQSRHRKTGSHTRKVSISNGFAGLGSGRRSDAVSLADLDGDSATDTGEEGAESKIRKKVEVVDRRGEVSSGLTGKDRNAFILLVILCHRWLTTTSEGRKAQAIRLYSLQGIPIGITFGTLPFLLKPRLSYSQLALFSLSTWPYSLKLLWSPIVDAWFWNRLGRRKSWIVPSQMILGLGMWFVGFSIETWLNAEEVNVKFLTIIFVIFIFFAATQDIAVDGWALTLLSPPNLSYASTAQTIGLAVGYTMSFTVFLALNSIEFSNRWLRTIPQDVPLVSLGGYLRFWAGVFFVFSMWLMIGKTEEPTSEDDPDMDVRKVYSVMWSIVRLKNIQSFLILHLVSKIGFQISDVTPLKLIEKGLPKEDLAFVNLLNVPFELAGGWLAARWSRGNRPLKTWQRAFWIRFFMAGIATALVWAYPSSGIISYAYFSTIIAVTLLSSFAGTVQFVGITAFHTQIADPLIGGTYMTLLNTVSNLGGTWPRAFVLRGIDFFSQSACHIPDENSKDFAVRAAECISDHGKAICADLGGECVTERDGYYIMSAVQKAANLAVKILACIYTQIE
ncbi:hypothetical protein NliqN6_2400 [Naganishia liquefaciens]|uniref:MFS transporter n=1 Tax=Naganishia liquefaciens TaxID=104408 RepID=A0A8H3TSB8_9TREE|nr:hypothetical protein NliqN6_2400 [Naganishia liquefaciens]